MAAPQRVVVATHQRHPPHHLVFPHRWGLATRVPADDGLPRHAEMKNWMKVVAVVAVVAGIIAGWF